MAHMREETNRPLALARSCRNLDLSDNKGPFAGIHDGQLDGGLARTQSVAVRGTRFRTPLRRSNKRNASRIPAIEPMKQSLSD